MNSKTAKSRLKIKTSMLQHIISFVKFRNKISKSTIPNLPVRPLFPLRTPIPAALPGQPRADQAAHPDQNAKPGGPGHEGELEAPEHQAAVLEDPVGQPADGRRHDHVALQLQRGIDGDEQAQQGAELDAEVSVTMYKRASRGRVEKRKTDLEREDQGHKDLQTRQQDGDVLGRLEHLEARGHQGRHLVKGRVYLFRVGDTHLGLFFPFPNYHKV